MSDTWSPATYLRFEDERTRAARDLLAQVPLTSARSIVDVGCGPGNSTALLVARFPQAEVTGVDSSKAMLGQARAALPDVRFQEADAAVWLPGAGVDLVFGNAVFQWLPDHLPVLARILAALAPGAVLAVQMPDNVTEPTHRLMEEVAADARWADRLAAARRAPLVPVRDYYNTLRPWASRLEILAHHLQPCPRRPRGHRRVGAWDRTAAVSRSADDGRAD